MRKKIKNITIQLSLALSIFFLKVESQNHFHENDEYAQVKIWLIDKDIHEFRNLNLDLDHGVYKKDTWFETPLSHSDIEKLRTNGYEVEILIEDLQQFFRDRNNAPKQKNLKNGNTCFENNIYPEVENFELGSMGGFYTYEEMLEDLDSMASKYPHLIKPISQIDTFTSWENRPIFYSKISNNPNIDSNKPKALYTSLLHAREPGALSVVMYFMWYLLENYDTNPEVKYLVDNTELYFVPCINPDGYIYNQNTNPNGGGMHRKNRRDVGTSNKGVDLNRNFAYEWGGTGSSNNNNSDIYRGPEAFSEPETQAVKWLVENYQFEIALNYHTYGNLLLFPWGYTEDFQCPDHDLFENFTNYMVQENNYSNIQSAGLYPAAGDSDDWMYGDTSTKPKIFALTPEVGSNSDNFWPPTDRIIEQCKENLWQNISAAKILLENANVEDLSSNIYTNSNGYIPLSIERLGLKETTYEISIQGINDCFSNIGNPITITQIEFGEKVLDSIAYSLNVNEIVNNQFQYIIQVNTANFTSYDTITRYFGDFQIAFKDDSLNMLQWEETGDWGKDNDYFSPPFSTSDSPFGNYENNTTNTLISKPIDLTNAALAFLNFYAKWNIEANFDYMQISASSNGSAWMPLCGNFTKKGSQNQDENQPVYDGIQEDWVFESIDLNDFLGTTIQLKFEMVSDAFINADGFKFDDLEVIILPGSPNNLSNLNNENFIEMSVFPNPSSSEAFVSYKMNHDLENSKLEIINLLGKKIYEAPIENSNGMHALPKSIQSGIYFIQIKNADKILSSTKWIKTNN